MARIVSTYKFRNSLSDYLDEVVEDDAPIVVSRFGKPLVVVSPFKKSKIGKIEDYFGFLGGEESGEEFVNRVRRSKKEKSRVEALRKGNV